MNRAYPVKDRDHCFRPPWLVGLPLPFNGALSAWANSIE